MRSIAKSGIVLLLILTLAGLTGCAQEVGNIDRTQSEQIEKEQFGGVWYYVKTVIDAPYSTRYSFQGEMNFGEGAKIVFDLQENKLIAYPVIESVVGMEEGHQVLQMRRYWDKSRRGEFMDLQVGQPVAIWSVASHFDLKQQYNPATGEQSNVLEENTTDRPWFERDYVRIDWNSEELKEGFFISGRIPTQSVHYVEEDGQNPLNPDAPDFDADYIGIVNNYAVTPSTYNCTLYVLGQGDCTGSVIKVRHSFKRADPMEDVEIRVYTNAEHMDKFGFFLSERHDYDEWYGHTESGREYKANLWKLWAQAQTSEPVVGEEGESVSCNTNGDCPAGSRCMAEEWFNGGTCQVLTPMPYRDRELNPVIYHMNPGFPGLTAPIPMTDGSGNLILNDGGEPLYSGGDVVFSETTGRAHPFVIGSYEAVDQWSDTFKNTVAWLYHHEDLGTLHMDQRAEGARACEQHSDCLADNENVLAWSYADSTDKVGVSCADSSDCESGLSCEATSSGTKACAEKITCADGPCPFGGNCGSDSICTDDDGNALLDPASKGNDMAWTFVAYDDDDGLVSMVRLMDNILPYDISPATVNSNGLVRFVNASPGTSVDLVAVLTDPANTSNSGQDAALTETDLYLGVKAHAADIEGQEAVLGYKPAQYEDDRFDYILAGSQKFRRLEVRNASGEVLAELPNVKITAGKSYVFVYAGGKIISADSFATGNKGVRVVNAVDQHDAIDIGLDSLRLGQAVGFGSVLDYTEALVEGVNRVVALGSGSPGDVTCYNDEGVGKCVGWGPILDDSTDQAVAEIQSGLQELFVLCEPIYAGEDCDWDLVQSNPLSIHGDCRYSVKNEDGTVSNPCKDLVPHHDSLKKIGDARYNHVYWVGEAQAASPLGYGPSAGDPETGRIFHAAANIYGASMVTYGTYASDLLDLVNGNLDVEEVVTGSYIADYIKGKQKKEVSASDLETLPSGLTLGSSLSGRAGTPIEAMPIDSPIVASLVERLPAAHSVENKTDFVNQYLLDPAFRLEIVPDHSPMHPGSSRQARLDMLRGTWIDDSLMIDEVVTAMSGGEVIPGMPIEDHAKDHMSLAHFGGPDFIQEQSRRDTLLAKNNVYMGDFVDGALVNTSLELGCTNEKLEAGATEVADYVTAVDLIETAKEAGSGRLPEGHCLSGEALRYVITWRMFNGVLEHEIGHTVGLRHNFGASGDVFNYFDEWYDIRERETVHCLDNGGCDYGQGEICVTECETNADCPSFAECEPFTGDTFACFDKRDEYNDVIGVCMGAANLAVAEQDCQYNAADYLGQGPVEVKVWNAENGVCETRTYCENDVECGQGQFCDGKDYFCSDESGVLSAPAILSSCETDLDCGEGNRCATPSLGEPDAERYCVGEVKKIIPRAKMTENEALQGRTEYQYSTVMDYGQKINADVHGLGKYDYAAIRFGYGDLVEVYKDTSHIENYVDGLLEASSSSVGSLSIYGLPSFWMTSIYTPFHFLNDAIGPENAGGHNRTVVPWQQVKLDREMTWDYLTRHANYAYKEVPYEFCSDEYRGNLGCYIFDTGADDLEIVEHAMGMLRNYYIFDAFQRDRLSFGWGYAALSYYSRILSRWMSPMRNSGVYNGLYTLIFSGYGDFWRQFTKEPLSGSQWSGSAELAVQYLSELIASPAPGTYEVDPDTGIYEHMGYEQGVSTEADAIDVPLGVGKFPYTTFDSKFGYYMWRHPLFVGSYWEKLAALVTLTDNDVSFLSDYVGEQLTVGVSSSIGFNTMYPGLLGDLFGGIIADNPSRWWGRANVSPTGEVDYSAPNFFDADPESNEAPLVRPSLDNNRMRALAAIYAMTSLPAGFDPSATDALAVVMKGNHSEYDLGQGLDWVEFSDPFSGKTFLALKPQYDSERAAPAYDMIMTGNELVDSLLDPETTDVQAASIEQELEDLIYMLQLLRKNNELFGTIQL